MYPIIEKLIDLAIPQWDLTLDFSLHNKWEHNTENIHTRIKCQGVLGYVREREELVSAEGPQRLPNESDLDLRGRQERWWEANREYIMPEPEPFVVPPEPINNESPSDLRRSNQSNGIQVIVKLANINLTPEKPNYDGGSWHIEGQMNEHIVATALYYYDSENISSSRLSFRQSSMVEQADFWYDQDEHRWLPLIFGAENDDDMVWSFTEQYHQHSFKADNSVGSRTWQCRLYSRPPDHISQHSPTSRRAFRAS